MRFAAILASILIASFGYFPQRLSPSNPQIQIPAFGQDCAPATADARILAHSLGYSAVSMTCGGRTPLATLSGPVHPYDTFVPGLLTYSENAHLPFHEPSTRQSFEVADSVPFASGNGKIVGYIKPDAMLISLQTDNPVETTLELLDAGIARADIAGMASGVGNAKLVVRVRPVTGAQVRRIVRVAESAEHNQWPIYWAARFVTDCPRVIAALGTIALRTAREHAQVLAEAAQARLGAPIGVLDYGAVIPDAICLQAPAASLHDLIQAVVHEPDRSNPIDSMQPHIYATVVRSLSAAWRLNVPANPPGRPWYADPLFNGRCCGGAPFVADGKWAIAPALLPGTADANRAQIDVPQWVGDALSAHGYAKNDDFANNAGPRPVSIVLRAPDSAQLEKLIFELQDYVKTFPQTGAKMPSLSIRVWRSDCSAALDAALALAARNAIAKIHAAGGAMRLMEERDAEIAGMLPCTAAPRTDEITDWPPSKRPLNGGGVAEVYAAM